MSLARYATFRIALSVPIMVGILALTFVLTHVLPTNPAVLIAGDGADANAVAEIEHRLGLDAPLLTQFWNYLVDLVHGDLGRSIQSNSTIMSELLQRIPSTLLLITIAIPLSGLIGIALAAFAADRRGPRDYASRAVGTLGTAVPDYLFALAFILVFFATLRWAPAPLGQAGGDAPTIPRPTGAYLLDAIAARNAEAVGVGLTHLILPVAALTAHFCAPIYRIARAALEDAVRGPYVDYAVMMGGGKRYVWRMTMANALPPVLTISGFIYGHMLGGAVLVEVVFGWGGIGQYAVDSIFNNDYFAIQGFVLVVAIFSVLVYLLVDLVHASLDPRVRAEL
jgi:peptide/nickel transport system permease protein